MNNVQVDGDKYPLFSMLVYDGNIGHRWDIDFGCFLVGEL